MFIFCYVCCPPFTNTDSYTTNDIVFKWNTTDIRVGTKQMAQFEYKGAKLSSDIDVFDIGKHSYHPFLQLLSIPSLLSYSSISTIPKLSFSYLHLFSSYCFPPICPTSVFYLPSLNFRFFHPRYSHLCHWFVLDHSIV